LVPHFVTLSVAIYQTRVSETSIITFFDKEMELIIKILQNWFLLFGFANFDGHFGTYFRTF